MKRIIFLALIALSFTAKAQSDVISDSDKRFKVKPLKMNSDQQEFGVSYLNGKVVFASTNAGFQPIKRTWKGNNLPFLDLYTAETDSTLEITNVKPLAYSAETKYHKGPATFNAAGDVMIFTANSRKVSKTDTTIRLELYQAKLSGESWQTPSALPFNNKAYSVGHASLSADGNTLYFVSDMPGGFGGTDIYKAEKQGSTWGTAVNLGSIINTKGNEMFPFNHTDGLLFFASDGLNGVGGLDVFVSEISASATYSKPKNMGKSINTEFDDFAFVMDADQKYGFLSSNRTEGKGNDDIYGVEILKPFKTSVILAGLTKDSKGTILAEAAVKLFNSKGIKVAETVSDKAGKFSFNVDQNADYKLTGEKVQFVTTEKEFSTHEKKPEYHTELILIKGFEAELIVTITDKKTGLALPAVDITYETPKTSGPILSKTDTQGKWLQPLGKVQESDTLAYSLKFKLQGYVSQTIADSKIVENSGKIELRIQLDKIEIGGDIGKMANLKPIYFDFQKYTIRPDAAKELDKIVDIMNENPSLEIELASHTDSRGNNSQNATLATNRANSSANYIIKKGIDKRRISGKGYGEVKPLTVTEEINVQYPFLPVGQVLNEKFIGELTKAQAETAHQLNRRTEFIVVKQ